MTSMPDGVSVATMAESVAIAERLRDAGKTVVFTNGCFDVLHIGHVRYLQAARALGDALIVGVNSDASVRRLKGPARPLVCHDERAWIIGSLKCVDHVVVFDDDTPESLITAIRPDVLVKGGDYQGTEIVGAAQVRARGGKVALVDVVPGRSTTNLIALIAGRAS